MPAECGSPANSANVTIGFAPQPPGCGKAPDSSAPVFWFQKTGGVTAHPVVTNIETGRRTTGFRDSPILGNIDLSLAITGGSPLALAAELFTLMTNADPVPLAEPGAPGVSSNLWTYEPTAVSRALTFYFGIPDSSPTYQWGINDFEAEGVTVAATAGAFLTTEVTGHGGTHNFFGPPTATLFPILGTHPGPQLIGTSAAGRGLEGVWVQVINKGAAPSTPLRYKVVVKEGIVVAADFLAAQEWEQEYVEDGGELVAVWRRLLDQDGLDVGTIDDDGNKQEVQIQFPGTLAATAATIEDLDTWVLRGPLSRVALAPSYVPEESFTIAHVKVFVDGDQISRDSATLTWEYPATMVNNDSSNDMRERRRTDEPMMKLDLSKGVLTPEFQLFRLNGTEVDVKVQIEGQQHTGATSPGPNIPAARKTIEWNFVSCVLEAAAMTISDAAPITEALTFRTGTAGFTFRIISED